MQIRIRVNARDTGSTHWLTTCLYGGVSIGFLSLLTWVWVQEILDHRTQLLGWGVRLTNWIRDDGGWVYILWLPTCFLLQGFLDKRREKKDLLEMAKWRAERAGAEPILSMRRP